MATIHRTTMVPGKLDLLGDWLPRQPCYRDAGGPPTLTRAGGFPLDDPAGDVGIEFTSEHGVLGRRWIYDAAYDPVAVAQLLAFIGGASAAQHQNESGTPDPSVVPQWTPAGRLSAPSPLEVPNAEPDRTTIAVDLTEASPAAVGRLSLDILRILRPTPVDEQRTGLGSVEADWARPDGGTARGAVAIVR